MEPIRSNEGMYVRLLSIVLLHHVDIRFLQLCLAVED